MDFGTKRHLITIRNNENITGDIISNSVCHLCLLCSRKFFQIKSFNLFNADIFDNQPKTIQKFLITYMLINLLSFWKIMPSLNKKYVRYTIHLPILEYQIRHNVIKTNIEIQGYQYTNTTIALNYLLFSVVTSQQKTSLRIN